MSILVVLIGASLIVALVFLFAFIFAIKSDQYSDTFSPAHRILFDDSKQNNPKDSTKNET